MRAFSAELPCQGSVEIATSKRWTRTNCVCMVAVALAGTGQALATPMDTSWIFRSQVTEGQSMWGPGTHTSYSFSDKYVTDVWPIAGTGFEWGVLADQGTVRGNVEGWVRAKYDNYVQGTNTTRIQLSYAGIDGESNVNTSFGVSLTATPRFRAAVLPWPFPSIDWSLPLSWINTSVRAGTDFTTGLGQLNTASGKWEALPFGLDAAIFSGYLNISLDQDIYFTPRSIVGTVKATHIESGATRTADVLFAPGSGNADVDLNLDLNGHWDICMEDFSVVDNTFRQELGLLATLGFKVPLLGVDLSVGTDGWFNFAESEFALAFNNHAFDGNAATPDVLGRFSIYVDPVPEPASVVLLALGGLAALHRKRR